MRCSPRPTGSTWTSRRSSTCQTEDWGVQVTLVELKDIQLRTAMKCAMARQAEAERKKRAKIIAAEGESLAAAALGEASDIDDRPSAGAPAPQPADPDRDRVSNDTTVVFPGPLMSTVQDRCFVSRETAASRGQVASIVGWHVAGQGAPCAARARVPDPGPGTSRAAHAVAGVATGRRSGPKTRQPQAAQAGQWPAAPWSLAHR